MNERQNEIIETIKRDKKTEQISFRCTAEDRKKIESMGKKFGLNISQTMEFILTSVIDELYSESVEERRVKSIPKSVLGL